MGTVPSSLEGEGGTGGLAHSWSGTPASAARCRPHQKAWDKVGTASEGRPSEGRQHASAPAVSSNFSAAVGQPEKVSRCCSGPALGTTGDQSSEVEDEGSANLILVRGEPGYEWAQYGTKQIAGGQRLYQKCRYPGCGVKKIIEVADSAAAQGSPSLVNKQKLDGEHTHGPATITLQAESVDTLKELVWKVSSSIEETKEKLPADVKTFFIECTPKIDVYDDGFSWRKYGEKKVKGCMYKRAYYRCSTSKQCPARKTVEYIEDGKCRVTYKAIHNHICPSGPPLSLSSPTLMMAPAASSSDSSDPDASPSSPHEMDGSSNEDQSYGQSFTVEGDRRAADHSTQASARQGQSHYDDSHSTNVQAEDQRQLQEQEIQQRQQREKLLMQQEQINQHIQEQRFQEQQLQEQQFQQQFQQLQQQHEQQHQEQQTQQQQQQQEEAESVERLQEQIQPDFGLQLELLQSHELHDLSAKEDPPYEESDDLQMQERQRRRKQGQPVPPKQHRFHEQTELQEQLQLQYLSQELRQQRRDQELRERADRALQDKLHEEERARQELANHLIQAPVQAHHVVGDSEHEMLFEEDFPFADMGDVEDIGGRHKRKRSLEVNSMMKRKREGSS